jgi:photosystem II stability/assembly factor-like uncharacterized protein
MKRIFLLITILAVSSSLQAQRFMPSNSNGLIKLSDVVAAYEQEKALEAEESNGSRNEENEDYHFGRWQWYWSQHLDEDGYMVPTMCTYLEWQKMNQAKSKGWISNSNWSFVGPTTPNSGVNHGIGRINAMEFHPTDSNTYWICAAGGGVWKTTNNGASWTALSDDQPVLGTSDIDVNPLNTNTLYLCTGDRDAGDTYSVGVLKSTDGGQTWNTTGLTWNTSQYMLANCLLINKLDTNSLTLASNNGIYKSYNGGSTWTQVKTGNFKQVIYHPVDTNILFAAIYDPANIYRSADGGKTWAQVTNYPGRKRAELAVTPANPAIVKAVFANSANGLDSIYNSTDTGKTFKGIFHDSGSSCAYNILNNRNTSNQKTLNCGGQGWYDLCITIDPLNANRVFVGGVNTYSSSNGGTSWTIINQWGNLTGVAPVHADKHFLKFHPLVPNRLFECNDGGIFRTNNPAATSIWTNVTAGLGITQFYRNAVAGNANYILAGAQDNGTKRMQGSTWTNPGGADGMNCEIDYADSATYYIATQYGDIFRRSTTLGDSTISNAIAGRPSGAWVTPYIISPVNHLQLLAGFRKLYFTANAGNTFTDSSVAFYPSKYIYRIAMSPRTDSSLYVVMESHSKVYYTHNFVPGNMGSFDSISIPTSYSISDIRVDPADRKHIWLSFSGFGGPHVGDFRNGTFSTVNNGLPNVPVLCLEIDSAKNMVYAGTEIGVYYLDSSTMTWKEFNQNLPRVEVTDLGINYATQEIWAATYGRGVWKSTLQYIEDTTDAIASIPFAKSELKIIPNPNNGQFTLKAESSFGGKEVMVLMIDNVGRTVLHHKAVFDSAGRINMNTQGIPKGVYIVELTTQKEVLGRKRVIISQ